MKISVLCPGPSLSLFPGGNGFDLTIGVNRTVLAHKCDVWACGDYPLVEKVRGDVIGSPVLFTAATSDNYLRDHSPAHDTPKPWREVTTFESLYDFCDRYFQWDTFSATAAIVYAAWSCGGKPGVIHSFGVDWSGELDWDGTGGFGNRSVERWQFEAAIWQNRLVPWLASLNIEIIRHRT